MLQTCFIFTFIFTFFNNHTTNAHRDTSPNNPHLDASEHNIHHSD